MMTQLWEVMNFQTIVAMYKCLITQTAGSFIAKVTICRYFDNQMDDESNYFDEEFRSNSRCFVAFLTPSNEGILVGNDYSPKCYQVTFVFKTI